MYPPPTKFLRIFNLYFAIWLRRLFAGGMILSVGGLALAEDRGELYGRAQKFERERRWKDAAMVFESIPDDANARYTAGLDWEAAGDMARAEVAYESILRLHPKSPEEAKARFVLALFAQSRNDFAEMERRLLWFLHKPKDTMRRPEALWHLGAHYLTGCGDRWAAYGCFETLCRDYPGHDYVRLAARSWSEAEARGDFALWGNVQAQHRQSGRVPDRLPLFLLNASERAGKVRTIDPR